MMSAIHLGWHGKGPCSPSHKVLYVQDRENSQKKQLLRSFKQLNQKNVPKLSTFVCLQDV